jgi:hypothetical protein
MIIRAWLVLLAALLTACTPPVVVPDPALWFPSDFQTSRARFRADCERLKSGPADYCRSWKVESRVDQDLTIDHGFFSKGGDRLLVIQSGIHGSEAQSGAAVEAYVMNTYVPALVARGIDVVLIHTLNPYGFKYDRRTDEFNVNLNRNFSADGSVYKIVDEDYRTFRSVFEPSGPVGNVAIASLREDVAFFDGFAGNGFKVGPLIDGLDNGQYEFPRGLNYGGTGPQQQTRFLRQEIGPIMARPYKKVLFLDYHTGLGDDGVLSVILGMKPASGPLAELTRMLGGQDKNGIVIKTASSPGYFATFGDVIDFAPGLARRPETALAVTMEYGTLGTDPVSELKSATRMILENQAHFNGCVSASVCQQVADDFRALFNPSDNAWRVKVLREADLVFGILLDKF